MTDTDDHVERPEYVAARGGGPTTEGDRWLVRSQERSAYAALEAHALLLTDQLQKARGERDAAARARDLEAGAAHRAERERDEAREQLGAAYQQRTRLADRADRLAEQALAAQHVAEQEQARAVFAIEQRDRLEQERDRLAKRVAELAEQVTTPAVLVDPNLQECVDRQAETITRLTLQRDDARKAAREGDQHLAELVESRAIRATLEAERDTLRSAMIVARDRATAAVQNLANHVGHDPVTS